MRCQLNYELQRSDFPAVRQMYRPVRFRILAVTLAYLAAASVAPAVVSGTSGAWIALPYLVVVFTFNIWGYFAATREMQRKFEAYCGPRLLQLSDASLRIQWQGGWAEYRWPAIGHLQSARGWLALYRRRGQQPICLLPPNAVAAFHDSEGSALAGFIQERIEERIQDRTELAVSKDVSRWEDTKANDVELLSHKAFQLHSSEAGVVAERGFQARESPVARPLVSTVVLVASIAVLMFIQLPDPVGMFVRQFLVPTMALVLAMSLLAPIKRVALKRLLLDQAYVEPQDVLVMSDGVEHQMTNSRSFTRWSAIELVVDAKNFVVVVGGNGALVALPRRAFDVGDDDAWVRLIAERVQTTQEAREAETSSEAEDTPAYEETGNPYQSPH